eukprot:756010-Prorocentrum_minimum.AAC.5
MEKEGGPRAMKCAAVQMGGSLPPIKPPWTGPPWLRPPTDSSTYSNLNSVSFYSYGPEGASRGSRPISREVETPGFSPRDPLNDSRCAHLPC